MPLSHHIREIQVEDLLGRNEIKINLQEITGFDILYPVEEKGCLTRKIVTRKPICSHK
ncbi:hypothetical protein [Parabacteroides pacaensis]|uniref:hypothetical protein n=1 Tax=Parabacteroides pacaensis TaxID=2086575 RepID=UPI00131B3509|nr:hypothetical protein [Parabacteroides pacaensis]